MPSRLKSPGQLELVGAEVRVGTGVAVNVIAGVLVRLSCGAEEVEGI